MKFITRISFLKSHKIIVSKDKEVFKMKKIMETTHLRLKDLKHIQREEIDPKF